MTIQESVSAAIAAAACDEKDYAQSYISEVQKYCRGAAMVFEIGAYTGLDIPAIHRLWPDAEIHCFEPLPEAFEALKKFQSDHIICNNMALTSKSGPVTFYQVVDSRLQDQAARSTWFKTAGSLLHCGAQQCGASPTLAEVPLQVAGASLDDYCGQRGLKPDILLIDTQGSEYQIFEGGTETLKTVKAILCEWSKLELYKDQKMLADLEKLLGAAGFAKKFEVNQWSNFHGDAVFARA